MTGGPRLGDHAEVEFKLSAVGADPDRALADLASLDVLAGHELGPPRRHAIRDVYWDTRTGELGRRRLTLRLREIDGEPRFTLKGGGSSDRGLFRRDELEIPADADGWQVVRDELAGLGIPLPSPPATATEPTAWLAEAGLVPTQDRTTERIARLVYREGLAVAELALDTTRYRFGRQVIPYREVEIEQLADPGATSAAQTLGEALLALMPGQFERATMGKYARGLQIGRALGDRSDDAAPER